MFNQFSKFDPNVDNSDLYWIRTKTLKSFDLKVVSKIKFDFIFI
jgi:hypothetical protein